MFPALHHSAHAATHVVRAMLLESAVSLLFISEFLRPIQEENGLRLLPLFLCFVEQNKDFRRRKS